MKKHSYFRFSLITALAVWLAACTGPATTAAPTTAPEPVTVRIGVLPILDALPLYVADAQGQFAAQNVTVEFVPVASAAERDQLMQAGQIDAMINDLISTLFYNREATTIVIVRFARTATSTYPQYRILAGKDSGITDVAGLRGVEIAISQGTVIEYVTDRLLQAEGLTPDDIKVVAIPVITERLAALSNGTVKAATIPDPAALAAIAGGATVVVDDTRHPEYGNSVFSFSAAFVSEHPDAVKGFLAAYEQAVADINADKTRWNDTLLSHNLLSQALIGSYTLPDYPGASVPTEAQFTDVNDWAKGKGLITADVSYAESVNASFLP
jgi:NitT/TauT family transport system substrate-binding protein